MARPAPSWRAGSSPLSGGNPLAITELAAEAGPAAPASAGGPTPVPTALSRLYADRAAGLDPQALTAALIAAAAGEDLGRWSAGPARPPASPVAALAAAESAGLLSLDGDRVAVRPPAGPLAVLRGRIARPPPRAAPPAGRAR